MERRGRGVASLDGVSALGIGGRSGVGAGGRRAAGSSSLRVRPKTEGAGRLKETRPLGRESSGSLMCVGRAMVVERKHA